MKPLYRIPQIDSMNKYAPHNPALRADYQKNFDHLNDQVLRLDRQIFRLLEKLGYTPQIIFDIGASDGVWSFYMKQVLPEAEFYLFEPLIDYSSDYAEFISETLRIYPSFHLFKYALGEKNSSVTMNVFDNILASTTLALSDIEQKIVPLQVPMLTLDEAIQTFNLPIPQVIKVDTQGNELSILKGSIKTLPKVDVLFLECWLYRGYGKETPLLTELADWLLQFDFRLWDVTEPYRNPDGVLGSLDCIFINTQTGIAPNWYY
jgi:FkbM family methyltransferase